MKPETFHLLNQPFPVELAVVLVHLGYLPLQFFLVALREASHDVQAPYLPLCLGICKLQYGVDALLLGVFYESAGIDDDGVARYHRRINGAAEAVLLELPLQALAVNEIL